jgi:hypothetical protein
MQEFEEWLLSHTSANIIETNINALPTPRYKDLHSSNVSSKTTQRGYEIFVELLLRFQPEILILHGQEAQKAMDKLIKNHSELSGTKAQWYDDLSGSMDVLLITYPDGRRATVFKTPHLSRYKHYPEEFSNIRRCIQMIMFRLPTSRHSWQNIHDMPARHQQLRFSFSIRERDMRRLKYGFYPVDMVEKWFVYTEGSTTYFHRSWSGYCIFQIRFERIDLEYRAAEILVNREPRQFSIEDVSESIQIIQETLKGLFKITYNHPDYEPPIKDDKNMTEIDFSKYRVKTIYKKERFSTNDKTRMSHVYGFTDYREIERTHGVCLFFDKKDNLICTDHSGRFDQDNIRSVIRTDYFSEKGKKATRVHLDEIYKITVIYVSDYSERIALEKRINDTFLGKV